MKSSNLLEFRTFYQLKPVLTVIYLFIIYDLSRVPTQII